MTRPAARVAVIGLTLATLAGLTACSSGSSDGAAATTSPVAPTSTLATTTSGPPPVPCAWPTKANKDTLNVAYPDTNATYWAMAYQLRPGETLRLQGTFPNARYASFITYGPNGSALDVLTDRDLAADNGSTNPFAHGGKVGGSYTAEVRRDGVDAPGSVSALGPGQDKAAAILTGTIIYRVYLANPASDPTGGAGLPTVTKVGADGELGTYDPCPHPGANPLVKGLVAKNGPATDKAAPPTPIFIRPDAGVANLFPNPDNTYVATILKHTPGQIVVVQGKSPTFPDTAHGEPVTSGRQVRYWSLCTNEYRKPYPVSFCAADQDVKLAADGTYTIVVSTPEDRPANATTADGITWLDWGSTKVDNLLFMRQMLAAPTFTEAAHNLAPGTLALKVMGPYTPVGTYCASTTFAAGGAAACKTG